MRVKQREKKLAAVAGLLMVSLGVLATACGTTEVRQAVPSVQPEPTPRIIIEYLFEGINPIVSRSHAAIMGTITKVGEPRWSSVTGEPFEGDDVGPYGLREGKYRYATVRVERVLWDSPQAHGTRPFGPRDLRVKPGDELEVFAWGDGTATGGIIVEGAVYDNNVSGPVEEGSRVLWILEWNEAHFADGKEVKILPVLGLANDFQGNWTLRDGQAVSVIRDRTVPADPLIDRLLSERAAGRRGDRLTRGISNPLE